MRKLIIGKNGQIGRQLLHHLSHDRETIAIGRHDLDLARPETVYQTLQEYQPDVILNAAAYTQVDAAENDPTIAMAINASSVAEMAHYGANHKVLLIHYSTDYVFDGTKPAPYKETDTPNPLSVYGHSKKQAEDAILKSGCPHLILRTSWVYDQTRKNFPNTILALAQQQDHLDVVADQFGAPTHAELIASLTLTCMNQHLQASRDGDRTADGIYNLAAGGKTSWHEFARYLVEGATRRGVALACSTENILPVAATLRPGTAIRPQNSRLDCTKICTEFNLTIYSWQDAADRFLNHWVKNA